MEKFRDLDDKFSKIIPHVRRRRYTNWNFFPPLPGENPICSALKP